MNDVATSSLGALVIKCLLTC